MTQREASLITEMERALGHAIAPLSEETRLRLTIVEAIVILEQGSPAVALDTLRNAISPPKPRETLNPPF